MDLYRFFHPHHNPRLKKKPVRLQEICELELAAKELLRAMESASLRIRRSLGPEINRGLGIDLGLEMNSGSDAGEAHDQITTEKIATQKTPVTSKQQDSFYSSLKNSENASSILIDSSLNAVELAVELLQQLIDMLPEDSDIEMQHLLKERENAAGWEAWSCLLKERLALIGRSAYPSHNSALNSDGRAQNKGQDQENSTLCSVSLDDCSTSVSTPKEKRSITA